MKALAVLAIGFVAAQSFGQNIIQSQGHALTEDDIKLAHSMVTFLADGAPTEAEKLTLRAGLKKEFMAGPAEFRSGVDEVKTFMAEIRKLKEPQQLALARMTVVTLFYGLTKDMNDSDVPVIMKVIYKKNPILAYDEANQIALTKKDLDNSMRFLWFSNGVYEPNAQQKKDMDALGKVISQNYLQMSVEEKQFLAMSAITMPVLDYNWKKLSQAQRNQLMNNYNQNYQTQMQNQGQVVAKPIPSWGQNQNLDGDTYKFLSRMSMQNHLSMMNGIESMGGSDDYWTIRPGW
ncbi:MAG: hypothetical protein KDC26_06525 [Armatimonadetes bacterium]|nr:hypothetical protein [Armatimonadota bacterium]